MHHINHNLKWYRNHKRITQQELADMLGTSLGRIKTYETNKATPPIEIVIDIAQIMGVTIDALVSLPMDAAKYRATKKEKIQEYTFFDDLNSINSRLQKVEKALKQKLKQKA